MRLVRRALNWWPYVCLAVSVTGLVYQAASAFR